MSNFVERNNKNWKQLSIVVEKRQKPALLWISCDDFYYRQALLDEFIRRFSKFKHIKLSLKDFKEKSFRDFFKNHISNDVFQQKKSNYIIHLTDIETKVYPHLNPKNKANHFTQILNFEREILFNEFPFFIVFWSDTHSQILIQRFAPDFWDWVTYKFEFIAPQDFMPENKKNQQTYSDSKIILENENYVYNRINGNLKKLFDIDEGRIEDRITLYKSIISDYYKLNEFSKAEEVLEEALKIKNIGKQDLADIKTLAGNVYSAMKKLEPAQNFYEKALQIYRKFA